MLCESAGSQMQVIVEEPKVMEVTEGSSVTFTCRGISQVSLCAIELGIPQGCILGPLVSQFYFWIVWWPEGGW